MSNIAAIRSKLKIFFLEGMLRPKRTMDMVRLGTYYGGWWIPRIDPTAGAAFCVGAGLDVSFDKELKRLGYSVYTIDPTPASLEYLAGSEPDLTVIPVGVWRDSGELTFSQDREWTDSWSIRPAGGSNGRTLPVRSVRDLMTDTGESELSILKIDIERAEHEVIRSLIRDGIRPACLCVEFDDQRLRKVLGSVRALRRYGYELYQIDQWNYTFA